MGSSLTPGVLTKRKGTKESDTVRAILDYLALRGIFAWRQNSRVVMLPGRGGKDRPYRMGGMKGMADIIGIVPCTAHGIHCPCPGGKFLGIEVKQPGNKPTPEQLAFLQAVVKAGGFAFVAHSVADVQAHGL